MLIEDGILKAYDGDRKHVVIPDGVRIVAGALTEADFKSRRGHCKTKIQTDGVFYLPFCASSEIETLEMSDSVEEIGDKAFEHCENLESISFSKKLRRIGMQAFMGCKKLTRITIPSSVQEISTWAFSLFTIEALVYQGSIWQLEKVALHGVDWNVKRLRCTDCDVHFDQKPYFIDELTFTGTKAQLESDWRGTWILRRIRLIHCSNGDRLLTRKMIRKMNRKQNVPGC